MEKGRGHHGRRAGAAGSALAALAAVAALTGVAPVRAQSLSPNQPEAIRVRGLSPPPCPHLGTAQTIQPLRIQPRQVAAKNARGCLSAEDAVYGPDGCPVRFCGRQTPWLKLPPGGAQPPPP